MSRYVASGHLVHPLLGNISVRCLSTATRITARWKSADFLSVTVPKGLTSSRLDDALRQMTPRLLVRRPTVRNYMPGWTYRTPETDFEIRMSAKTGIFEGTVDRANRKITLFMPSDLVETGSDQFNGWVMKTLDRYARAHAREYLLPFARELASRLDVEPAKIDISYGQKVLGRCNSRREILLSRNLVFYPEELRELVVAHEYAHLTHLNHSRQFYELLDSYLDGRHGRLYRQLKAHRLPFLT